MEALSHAGRCDDKADMYSVVIIISELITSHMIIPSSRYGSEDVGLMVDAAVDFLLSRCPELAKLLRDGFNGIASARPSAKDMLFVLESPEVIASCTAAATSTVWCMNRENESCICCMACMRIRRMSTTQSRQSLSLSH